jgi:hypothetical protein
MPVALAPSKKRKLLDPPKCIEDQIDETLAAAPTVITFELPIVIDAYRKDGVEQVEDKVHAALGPGQRHCLEGPVEVLLLEALEDLLLLDLGQVASLQVEKVFAETPKLTVTIRPL